MNCAEPGAAGGFEIQASSRTLARNTQEEAAILWRPDTCYVIPIYQRPYSWGEQEVSRLINDLIDGHTGRHSGLASDPMFIGTMQIEGQVSSPENGYKWRHTVIDGQQRITTLILLLRALELASERPACNLPADYRRRLSTQVGGGVQQAYLAEALIWDGFSPFPQADLNRYQQNLVIIRNLLDSTPELSGQEDRTAFADYLLGKVFFVVIETRAGLSKTLQIFKSINTTGLDLNGGDIFKIRFYEYLRFLDGDGPGTGDRDQEIFGEVAKLYDEIDERNDKAGWHIAGMENILSIARHHVATEADLAHAARLQSGTTFFEHFFDVVINKQTHDGFARDKCAGFRLPLELMRQLIDVRFRWDEPGHLAFGAEAKVMNELIWWGRYGSYYEVLFLFCHRFRPTPPEIERFTIAFSKLVTAQSLVYERITEARKTFLHDLLKRFASASEETVDSITRHVEGLCASRRGEVLWALENHQLAWLSTKNLVCRLAAMLDEPDFPNGTADTLHDLLLKTEIDIEHIEACNHKDETLRERIWAEWGPELHSLGNLIVLERSRNRGSEVSNHEYGVKRMAYRGSKFATVRNFAEIHEDWTLEKAKERKRVLAGRIASYLCGPDLTESPAELAATTPWAS